jgi:hypothetical protein
LRSNLSAQEPEKLWQFYIQLTQVEAAFKDLKDDLSLRPIFTSLERRIEAHIFVSFLAYCLHVSLRACLRPLAPGLTPRSLLEKFAAMQMLDVHFPTTDGRELGLLPLHPAGERSQNAFGAIGLGTAAAIAAAHHAERPTAARISLVQTFLKAALICNDLHIVNPLQLRKSG